MSKARRPDQGVVLINVLVILALMATVVFAMVSLSEISITRSQRFSEAGQALALVAAGEASAIVALRRDLAEAPDSDHLAEPWAQIQQEEVRIEAGTFALTITDAQAALNLNSLPGSGALGVQLLQRVLTTLDLPAEIGLRIMARLAQPEPLDRLSDLEDGAGLTSDEVARLAELVTVLPGRTDININTAPEALLAALADNPVQARNLIGVRNRQGFLTRGNVTAMRLILPPGAGFRSSHFHVTTTVSIGGTTQSRQSLLQRRTGRGGAPEVVVVDREAVTTNSKESLE